MINGSQYSSEMFNLDGGISHYIQDINNMGHKTVMSCSGMEQDHYKKEKCPFICFEKPQLSNDDDLIKYLKFIGDCFYNSNWFVEYFSQYVVGYLPWGLNDSNIKRRFKKFVNNLKLREGFNYSY